MATNKIVLWVVVGIFVLGIVGWIVLSAFVEPTPQSFLPNQCEVKNTGTIFNYYKCPSNKDDCQLKVSLECDTKISEPRVVFRGSAQQSLPAGIAVDSNLDGALESYSRGSAYGGCLDRGLTILTFLPEPFQQDYVYERNGDVRICDSSLGRAYHYHRGGSVSTQSTPLEGESCDGSLGFIRCGGIEPSYQCSQEVTGDRSLTVTYSGMVAGTKVETFNLNANQEIFWDGRIDYEETELRSSECTRDLVGSSPNSYYPCVQDQFGCGFLDKANEQFCEGNLVFSEDLNQCTPPFKLKIDLEKSLYSLNEDITGEILISETSDRSFIEVRVSLENTIGTQLKSVIISTNSRGEASFNLGKQSFIGEYKVVAKTLNHPLGQLEVDSRINVEAPVFLRLNPDPDQIQYTANPISAKAFVTDSDGNPENVGGWDLTGTKCGSRDVSDSVSIIRIRDGEYFLSTPVNEECTFIYRVVAIDDSGFRSDPDAVTIQVKRSSILINPDLSAVQDKDEGRYTITFTTLDSNNQPIRTINNVMVIDSDACKTGEFCTIENRFIPTITVSGEGGFYSFSHIFKDGINEIVISSSTSGIEPTSEKYLVNLFEVSGGGGDVGTGGDGGGFPWGLVITGIVAVIGLGVFFWIFLRKRRR